MSFFNLSAIMKNLACSTSSVPYMTAAHTQDVERSRRQARRGAGDAREACAGTL